MVKLLISLQSYSFCRNIIRFAALYAFYQIKSEKISKIIRVKEIALEANLIYKDSTLQNILRSDTFAMLYSYFSDTINKVREDVSRETCEEVNNND